MLPFCSTLHFPHAHGIAHVVLLQETIAVHQLFVYCVHLINDTSMANENIATCC